MLFWLYIQIFVHLLRVVVLDLILEVVQQKHLWLIQSFDDAFHLCRAILIGTAIELLRYFDHLCSTQLIDSFVGAHD